MEKKIGESFEVEGKTLIVRENLYETHGWFRRRPCICNTRCAFWNGLRCTGLLYKTGDCQRRFREDGQFVFFENADFARPSRASAAAKSEKIVGKS